MLFGCYEIMACVHDAGLQAVFRSVVVAKILYASIAWSGFITATDRQRVDAFLFERRPVDRQSSVLATTPSSQKTTKLR